MSGDLPGVSRRGAESDVVHDALNFDFIVLSDEAERVSLAEFVEFTNVVVGGPVVKSSKCNMCVPPGETVPAEVRD